MEVFKNRDLLKLLGISGKPIEGVAVKRLQKIPDERGVVYHMLRNDDELFEGFGEIYFSKVYPGVVKGWHLHTQMFLNYAVIVGSIKLVLYDERENSKTQNNLMEIITGEDNYLLVKIPPFVWNGFKGIGAVPAIVANCASVPHHPDEIKRLDPFSEKIPYNWQLKNK